MVHPAEADALIAAALPLLPAEDCTLTQAHDRILRQAITADRDFPPFDRVTLDGYALGPAAVSEGDGPAWQVLGFQAAGMRRQEIPGPGTAWEVATGAVVPLGAELVLPYEEAERAGDRVQARIGQPRLPGQGIHRCGSDAKAGKVLVAPGRRLTGKEIALAAACGLSRLRVSAQPRIAVVATGDELVDVENPSPAPHQIRRSNDYALRATLLRAGFTAVERFHVRDHQYELEQQLKRWIAEFDVLVLCGGVSQGKYDFLPRVLAELGVQKRFHGVAQRPGKPFWFGVTGRGLPVFALPGNPLSAFLCLHRYVLPALERLGGAVPRDPDTIACLPPPSTPPGLTRFVPVKLHPASSTAPRQALPLSPNTSGDFLCLIDSDGFIEVGPEPAPSATSVYRYCPWL